MRRGARVASGGGRGDAAGRLKGPGGGQDPLREMAGLCVGKSDDVLSLTLHPLQDTLDRAERLRFLHRAFVTVVNEAPPRRSPRDPACLPRAAIGAAPVRGERGLAPPLAYLCPWPFSGIKC